MEPAKKLQLDQYAHTYKLGNSVVHIVAPNITHAEREQCLSNINSIIRNIWRDIHSK